MLGIKVIKIKRCLSAGISILMATSSLAQTIDDIGLITIGVSYPENPNQETAQLFDKLNQKVTKALTKSGCASYANCQFQCIPEIIIESTDVAEGGMKDVCLIKGNISITAFDAYTGTVFNIFSDQIKGCSTSKEKALSNAITESGLKNFNFGISQLKEKICDYYRKNKEVLFSQAQSMVDMGNYDEAIANLMTFPAIIVPDYYECLGMANDIYELKLAVQEQNRIKAQRDHNNSILVKAHNALEGDQPEKALDFLMEFETGIEDQDAEYIQLRENAGKNISEEKRLEYEKQERNYRDARADKEKDYQLKHKRIDMRAELENKRIAANLQIERERIQASERETNNRINAIKEIALNARLKK